MDSHDHFHCECKEESKCQTSVEPMFGWDYCNLRACKLVLDNYTEVAEAVKNTDTVVLDD